MSRLRIGFVGAGSMGQCAHLANYAALPECEVVALAEIQPELRWRVADRYRIPRTYPDHAAMLADEHLDAIVAAQPFDRHATLLPDLFRAGVPLFTEKPLAASVDGGERVLAALAQSGTWHMVGYHKRSDPATMRAKVEIDRLRATGELGRLTYVRITMPPGDWVQGGFTSLIRTDEPRPDLPADPPASDMDAATYAEYLAFVNYYIHQVNLMRHLMGEPYRVTYADPRGVLLAVEGEGGASGVIEMAPYSTTVDWQESALVCFERGWIRLDLPAPLAAYRPGRVTIYRDPGDGAAPVQETPTLPWEHAMRRQARNFLAAVRGERAPMCDASEAMEDLRVARQYIRLLRGV